jgi:hypothetical protein
MMVRATTLTIFDPSIPVRGADHTPNVLYPIIASPFFPHTL